MDQLKLVALDEQDLNIISAHVQDAVMKVGDLEFLPNSKRFVIAMNRFAWETVSGVLRKRAERRQSILHFDRVLAVKVVGIDRNKPADVLSLLAIRFAGAEAPAGTIQLDPNISSPYSHDATVYVERQLTDAIGARVGFVYKTEDDLIAQYNPGRPIEAYTVPYSFVDVGVDGVANSGDERTLTLLGVPNSSDVNTRFPLTNVVMNTPRFSRYKTLEASMNRRLANRWAAQIGGSYTLAHDFPGAYPNNPNGTFDGDTTRWDFKLSGTYEAPFGVRVSPLVRHQAGANFSRQISVGAGSATAAGAIFSGTINVEDIDSRRHDNITVLDVRVDRGFNLGGNVRLRGFLDLFNLTNSNAAESRTITTGASFLRPTAVLAPMTARIGARLSF